MPIRIVISESILKEGKEDFLKNQYVTTGKQVDTSTFNEIDEETFNKIYQSDPFNGKYAAWLLNLYKFKQLKLEDLYKAEEYLTLFDKVKQKLPNKDLLARNGKEYVYPSLTSLYKAIQPFEEYKSNSELKREVKKNESKKVYEDSEFLVIAPLTENATCYYGANTEWCTAAKKNNMFDYYNEEGQLYIIINKKENRKFQFHEKENQLMDENDSPVDWDDIFDNNESFWAILPLILTEPNQIKHNGNLGLFNNGKLIIKPLYDRIDYPSPRDTNSNYIVRDYNDTYGLISYSGEILIECGLYSHIGKADKNSNHEIELNKKCGLVDRNGNIILEPILSNFHYESSTTNYIGENKGKTALIDENGNYLIPFLYDKIRQVDKFGNRNIELNNLVGLMDGNLKTIIPIENEYIMIPNTEGEYFVQPIDGELYLINSKGKLIS